MLHVPGGTDDDSGSVGLIDPNGSLKLGGEDGREVDAGERGEGRAKGPNVCVGSWRNEEATKERFDEEGYLRTGDVAVRDEKGWYWIVDRKKGLIKVKGFQVAPAELEAVLLTHEDIADAAVCGVRVGEEELPRAYVVVKDKAKVNEDSIREWLQGKVAKHKWLLGGVKFVEEVLRVLEGRFNERYLGSGRGVMQRSYRN